MPATNKPCVLLPSASNLRNQFDTPLKWRVRLDRPPHRSLDYYFLRSGFSPHKIVESEEVGPFEQYSDELLNLEHKVYTPADCYFDSTIDVELKIEKEAKTARVKFIYAKGANGGKCVSVNGKPFYLDMTDTHDSPSAKAYIGLDFGTSNTSVSYVSQGSIKTYQKRSVEKSWQDLSQLHEHLPYPLAIPLAKYLSESFDRSNQIKFAREFVEAALTMAAYISFVEMRTLEVRAKSNHFKGFTQRSAGPLWKLLQEVQRGMGASASVSAGFKDLVKEPFFHEVNEAVGFFAQHKHEKADDTLFNPRVVHILANVCQKVFSSARFGYFENVQLQRFKTDFFKGIFKTATGDNSNFTDVGEYLGSENFPSRDAYLADFENRVALPLHPLVFWYSCERHSESDHCYLYDKKVLLAEGEESFSFKAAGFPCSIQVSSSDEILGPVADQLKEFCIADPEILLKRF